MTFSHPEVKKIIGVMKVSSLALAIFCGALLLNALATGNRDAFNSLIIFFLIFLVLFFGLRNKQDWLAPLAIILSILGFSRAFATPLKPSFEVVGRFFVFFLYLFLMFFFSRPETRAYLKVK